nr:hypothetical protein [uncultured Hyphomonas sp.]
MLFKMILDGASDDERHIAQGFLRHIIAGFAIGLIFGGTMFGALFLTLGKLDMNIPILFILAVLLQFGPIGGLIGAGVHVTRIADRGEKADDDDEPRGGTKAPVVSSADTAPAGKRKKAPKASPVPSLA